MKKALLFSIAVVGLLFVNASCKKKCDIAEEDTISGVIVDAIIYPESGGMITPNGLHIYDGSTYMDRFKISLDGGYSQQTVDYSQYNILGYPLTVNCDASIDRSVEIDNINGIVTYTVNVTECKQGCDELRNIENYVLVPAFPTSYTIVYDLNQ